MTANLLANVSCIAVEGRAILIEGIPGSGKSTLALALIDRGATLIGDDGIALERHGKRLWASPPPNIAGKLEIRGVGVVDMPTASAPLSLVVALGDAGERLPDPTSRAVAGVAVPSVAFEAGDGMTALRVEWALRVHGLPLPESEP